MAWFSAYVKRCQSPLLHEHQGSGSLEIEGGRERDENLEGTRHSGNNKYQISKINALSTVILAKVQPLSDVTVLHPKSGYMTWQWKMELLQTI